MVSNSLVRTGEDTFEIVSRYVREVFKRSFHFENDGDVSSKIVALRDAFYAFPVPTDVLLIDSEKIQAVEPRIFLDTNKEEGPIWTLIAYHAGEVPGRGITFHGTRRLAELDSYSCLLKERFGFREDDGSLDLIQKLTCTGFRDNE